MISYSLIHKRILHDRFKDNTLIIKVTSVRQVALCLLVLADITQFPKQLLRVVRLNTESINNIETMQLC